MKKIIVPLFLFFLVSCEQNTHQVAEKTTKIIDSVYVLTDAGKNSEGAFLFNNGQNIVLNWTEWDAHDSKQNVLKFAVFNRKTLKFDSIQRVPLSKGLQMHAESMAKVAIKKDGTLLAVYRKKPKTDKSRFGGLMYYTFSKDGGKTWTKQYRLVEDAKSTSQSFYDIALLPDDNLGLTWLDSRSKRRGKTLYFARTDTLNLFSEQKPIAFSTCECCRTELFVDSRGYIHVAYRNLIEPDEEGFDGYGQTEIRDMYYLKSMDTARNFSRPIPISKDNWHIYGCPHTGPSLAYDGNKLGAVWFTAARNKPGLFFTLYESDYFLPRKQISVEGRHPQMVAANGKFYRVYEEYHEVDGKGYYKIVLDIQSSDGSVQQKEISQPQTKNNHAVLTLFDDKLLIAWANDDTRHPKILYKIVEVEQ